LRFIEAVSCSSSTAASSACGRLQHQQLHPHTLVQQLAHLIAHGSENRWLRKIARQLQLQLAEQATSVGGSAAAGSAATRVDTQSRRDDVPAITQPQQNREMATHNKNRHT
jgi:hypothetical protein